MKFTPFVKTFNTEYRNDVKLKLENGGRPSTTVNHYSKLHLSEENAAQWGWQDDNLEQSLDHTWALHTWYLHGHVIILAKSILKCPSLQWQDCQDKIPPTVGLTCKCVCVEQDMDCPSAGPWSPTWPSDLTDTTAFEKLYNHSCGDMRFSCVTVCSCM